MEAVKRAIRSALEKGDAQDRAYREKVYRQAFAALERSLDGRPGLSAEDLRRRRERVKAIIIEIESEFVPAAPPVEPEDETDFPSVEREDRLSSADDAEDDFMPAGDTRGPLVEPRRRRSPFAMLFVLAVLVATVGIGAWWTLQTGILRPLGDAGMPAGPLAEEEDFDPGENAPAPLRETVFARDDWITVFSPDDPTSVRASSGATAEVMDEEDEAFLRIDAQTPDTVVSFDIGQGVLEQLAGRRAVFSLTARAEEGQETQISITCDFGALGGCGRRRYVVGPSATEYLFETEMPDEDPNSGGSIDIVPDVTGQGRTLDVFELRVTTAN